MKKVTLVTFAAIAIMFAASCEKNELLLQKKPTNESTDSKSEDKSEDFKSASMQKIPNQLAYYDSALFTINLKEMKAQPDSSIITHNKNINEIYVSEDLSDVFNQTYKPVISAIPGDGMNPMWLQFIIHFNTGHTPHQFYRDDAVTAAAASGEITLENTHEIYRCAVVGHKPM
jgi:hypothetical protein